MNQLQQLFQRLTLQQRILLGVAVAVMGFGLWGFVRWQQERDFKTLYTGMAPADAAAVTARLRERNIDFRLDETGTSILVPSARIAEARLDLAGAGLPKTGRIGFELFDKANLGVTDFAEQVNYHRAIEGELERSVMTLAEIEQARVHVTMPKDSVFLESRQPAKASVMVKLKRNRTLAKTSIEAIRQLAASAVEGLSPDMVSVIDMNGTLLSRARPHDGEPTDEEQAEGLNVLRLKLERDLLAKVQQTLEPVVGAEHFRAGVSAELDLVSGEQSEEVFDPAKSVMVTQQRSEEVAAPNVSAGVPGTPSALPRPTGRPAGASSNVARRTENVTFQSSRVVRKSKTPQGVLKRLSLSVLVDQRLRWEGSGPKAKRILEPPKPEELKTIRDLVAGAVGFNAQRGDQIFVESLAFESTLAAKPVESAAPMAPGLFGLSDPKLLVLVAVAAVAAVLMAAAAVFFILRKKKKASKAKVDLADGTPALEGQATAPAAIEGGGEAELPEGSTKTVEEMLAEKESEKSRIENEELAKLQAATIATTKADILTKHIGEEAKKNPEAVAQVLRTWLQED